MGDADSACYGDEGAFKPEKRPAAAGKQRELGVQRVAPGPDVELIQPGAEKEDQVAEEIACDQECGLGLLAIDRGKADSRNNQANLAHE